MSLEPPPKIVKEFNHHWTDWFFYLWDLVNNHTGGAGPISPATGTSWNAHGNTATGEADNPLIIDAGAFLSSGTIGNHPDEIKVPGTYLVWMPNKSAFRVGTVTDTRWSNIGQGSLAMGANANASATNSLALGAGAIASAISSIAAGPGCESGGAFASVSIGISAEATGINSASIGLYTKSTGSGSLTIGKGVDGNNKLENAQANTMYIGVNSVDPTLILKNQRCGVLEETPVSTLDVSGSVGYKTSYLQSGSPTTLADELVVIIDNPSTHTINLPKISTVPRRMYHIRRAFGAGVVTLTPDAADSFDEAGAGVSNTTLPPGKSIHIVADPSPTTDTWWII